MMESSSDRGKTDTEQVTVIISRKFRLTADDIKEVIAEMETQNRVKVKKKHNHCSTLLFPQRRH